MEQNGKGKWLRRSERERQAVMSRFERSGLGVEAFCQREGISAASFLPLAQDARQGAGWKRYRETGHGAGVG